MYFESFKVSCVLFPLHIYFSNSCAWRSPSTKSDQLFHIYFLPLKNCLHSTFRRVPNPTSNLSFHGLAAGLNSKEDALDSPAYEDMGSNLHVAHQPVTIYTIADMETRISKREDAVFV
jgi:hypothetical protein